MNDLIKIKKYYGENMMHLCRNLFPTILEQEDLLFSLLDSNFAHSKFLYEDIIENDMKNKFKEYIYSFINGNKEEIKVTKTPKELMSDAGYILYECHTEEDIQNFKKYYSIGEQLCTFKGRRLDDCHVFFAVKKNVDDIKRGNFTNPQRQDKYGTSVISIQFSRGKINTLSIKNRYNHTVNNPDATFSNNLENIIPGLTKSFEKEYNLNINQNTSNDFELPGYVKAKDGKYYKYNYEINNIYYCPDNVIIDEFNIIKYEKEKYLILDYFVLDLVNKKVKLYDRYINDSFLESIPDIRKIEINKHNNYKIVKITCNYNDLLYLKLDKYNRIISYNNEFEIIIGSGFLKYNKILTEINLPQAELICGEFLSENVNLTSISIPNVTRIGRFFLDNNQKLEQISLPSVKNIDYYFLHNNKILKNIFAPNLKNIYGYFLEENLELEEIDFPNVEMIGDHFIKKNKKIAKVNLPNTTFIGDYFLVNNEQLTTIKLENVKEIGNHFLMMNNKIEEISLPKINIIYNYFLFSNEKIRKLKMPEVTEIGDHFLYHNKYITEVFFPKLEKIGSSFLYSNIVLKELKLPKIKMIGDWFLYSNCSLKKINIKTVESIGVYFLNNNSLLKKLTILPTISIGNGFLYNNKKLKEKINNNREKSKIKKLIRTKTTSA